jgi:hypothetical protein
MSRENKKALKIVKVPSSIAILVPCNPSEADGATVNMDGESPHYRTVRCVWSRELIPLRRIAGSDDAWVNRLIGTKQLRQLEDEAQDPVVRDSAWEHLAPTFGFDSKKTSPPKDFKKTFLLPSLALAFQQVQLVFWYTRLDKRGAQRLLPGLFCPDLKTAAAARWLLDPLLRVCSHCQEIFMAKRPKQTACSLKCREAHRSVRWWARKKLREAA